MSIVRVLPRVAAVLAALVLLNASLTFYDVWPTPACEWHGHLSVELAAAVLLLALAAWRRPERGHAVADRAAWPPRGWRWSSAATST